MRTTKKQLMVLSVVFAVCMIATLLILFAGKKAPEADNAPIYLFANYTSSDQLIAASVENETGEIVLAQLNGVYYAVTDDLEGSDDAAVAEFFKNSQRIVLQGIVEGASAQDEQYGINQPTAQITLQDNTGDGVLFSIGRMTPNRDGYYTSVDGDDRVFIMALETAQVYLSDVHQYLALSFFDSLEGDGVRKLKKIQVKRVDGTGYELESAYVAESGASVYYKMQSPWQLLLTADQSKNEILTSLRQLRGVSGAGVSVEESGLMEEADLLTLTYSDGTQKIVRFGGRNEDMVYGVTEGTAFVYNVPVSSLAFLYEQPEEIIGKKFLNYNLSDIKTLKLMDHTYDISSGNGLLSVVKDGTAADASDFQNNLYAALSRISVQGAYEGGEEPGQEILHLEICTNIADQTIDLRFYQYDALRCAVAINGKLAVWCNIVAINALMDAVG